MGSQRLQESIGVVGHLGATRCGLFSGWIGSWEARGLALQRLDLRDDISTESGTTLTRQ